jgi:hypothetical protein
LTGLRIDREPTEEPEVEHLNKEQEELLLMGKIDQETPIIVTVSVHVTKSFRFA